MKRKLLLAALCVVGALTFKVHAQKDVTSQYITNATLSDGTNGWTKTFTKNQQTNDPADAFSNSVRGNNTVGYASEAYAGWGSLIQTEYSMKQTITLPAGNYRLVNYSFFRQGDANDANHNNVSKAYLKAGDQSVLIKSLRSIQAAGYANSQAEGANCFDSKMYRNVVEFTIAADNTEIEIGVEGTFDEARSWCIVGQFELFDLDDEASVSSPTDMTYAITNSGFEYRDWTGWTNEGFSLITNNDNIGGKSGLAYVEYYKWGGLENNKYISQTLTGLNNGLYEVSVYGHQQQGTPNDGVKLYANNDYTYIGSSTSDYSVRTTVTNNELTIKIQTEGSTANWTAFDKVRLKFYGDPLAAYQDLLDAAVTAAQALIDGAAGSAISATAKAAWQAVVDANDNDDNAFTQESDFSTAIANIAAANTNYQAMAAPYATWLKVKAAADAMVSVPNDNASATSTLSDATSTQNTEAGAALTSTGLNTAINTLKAAIKTFINDTEPTDGNKFEITCLIENPSFDNNTTDGWTRTVSSGGNAQTQYTCNEFWNNTFDFYQTLTGLPNGSYQLSVQGFCRPGGNDVAYPAYKNGTNAVTAELYVNNDASTVGNIYAYTGNTTGAKAGGGFPDYKCVVDGGTDYWVPNGMEGASLYFADEDVYKTTVAALVEDGNLRIGFRDESLTNSQWTIFDNFRLYYYGSDKSVYYAQYLPQLVAEVEADKSNALYANVTGKELSDLDDALGVDASGFTEEAQYSTAIQAIKDAQTAYRAAHPSYDALVAAQAYPALTEITANIGTGVFQYPATTNDLWDDYSNAKSAVNAPVTDESTAATVQALVDALDDAIEAYNGITLNAPDASKRYKLTLANKGALTFRTANTEGGYGMPFMTAADYLAQTFTLTPVAGKMDTYTLSFEDLDGNTRYVCTRAQYGEGGTGTSGIRTFAEGDTEKEALEIQIQASTTDNVFYMLNTENGNAKLGAQNNGDFYTVDDNSDWSIAEASQATVSVTIAATKYATRIFPFTPAIPSDVKVYSISQAQEGVLTLTEEETPEANKPYILYSESDYTGDETGYGTATEDSYTEGSLTGVYTESTIAASTEEAKRFVLQTQGARQAFYQVGEGGFTSTPYRCYLTVDDSANQTKARAFYFDIAGEDATAINALEVLTAGEYDAIYNAAGAKVDALQKGVNIIKKGDKTYKIFVK